MNTELTQRLTRQYERTLPFVAYHKPGADTVKFLMQDNNALHTTTNYEEQGFVMTPYARNKGGILISGIPENLPIDISNSKNEISAKNLPLDRAKEDYEYKVSQAIARINSGGLKKVVLSRKRKMPVALSPITLFERLVITYPDAFTYIWYHPKQGLWLGATPETLLSVNGLRFKTMGLAATQKYLENKPVIWGSKEQEEQQLVVETIREQLEELKLLDLKIKDRETVRAGNLLHLKTEISGRINSPKELPELLSALHPTPAVCGLPRDQAAEFIQKNEGYDRGFYTGFLGELNLPQSDRGRRKGRNIENQAYTQFNKTSDLYVNLRCMRYTGKSVEVYVGGGITSGSDPAKEWDETVNKMQIMLSILGE